jgi:hypothetical protein
MSAPLNPTRHQLEELDALLQRMLSLPLNQSESVLPQAPPPPPAMPQMMASPPPMAPRPAPVAPPAAPRRRAEPPSGDNAWNVPLPATGAPTVLNGWPVGIESLNVSATSTVTPKPAPSRLRVTSVPNPHEAQPIMPQAAMPAAPAGVQPQQRLRVEPPPMTIPIPPPRPQPLMPLEAPLPFYLWPMGVVDRTMGNMLAAFGPPGRWLGQGGGKVFFGWCGLVMLAAAAVWGVMDYMGWSW